MITVSAGFAQILGAGKGNRLLKINQTGERVCRFVLQRACLSIHQPFGELIVALRKTIDNMV